MPSTLGLPLIDPLGEHPGQRGGRRGDVRGGEGHAGPPSEATAEPALKPNQPTHSSEAPITVSVRLCGAIDSLPKPWRLPSISAVARPAIPALMCTTVPPAKSSTRALQPARGLPHPVRDRAVHHQQPDAHEPQHRREFHALGKRAADQRRSDDREGGLEHRVHGLGNRQCPGARRQLHLVVHVHHAIRKAR
jgi:hypothetical protein